ncbi:hypothetical protein SAMN04488030_0045 [Aliiroseovarius halocynthiae]|uniref:Type II secretion system protein n=1 Tax=Aliiroseovarius halocynthiae TaxID=985055 RepID=A0A545SLG6_9RHOB|nr:hypothetical protein [Aliiroseovarius halocynthiae]TQV65801.1 hypothetical protein FIL88_16010 [Aliiroseovarius halocynthiae]SMR83568.1 hypothetical protein SAMN04488030_0045 [Aliiroseovarius halocynthiae]
MNLFEVLIALAIMSAISAVVIAGSGGASPRLQMQEAVAALQSQAATSRHRAVKIGQTVVLAIEDADCNGDVSASKLHFFADGTARADALCLTISDAVMRLVLDPLTGRLKQVER